MKKSIFNTITILLVLFYCSSANGKSILIDRVVAVVGKEVVTWSELYKSMEFEFSGRLVGVSPEERRKILERYEKEYLEKIIDTKLQLNEARRKNITTTPSEVNRAVDDIRNRFGMTMDEFVETLKKEGFSLKEYKQKLAEQIIISKLIDREIRSKIVVTEDEIKEELKKEGSGEDKEELRLRQILLVKQNGRSDKELQSRAEKIIEELKAGTSFESLAIQYSEGPNAQQGGDLGYLDASTLAPPFKEALKGVEPGGYTKPFWTDRGIHILYLEDRIKSVDALKERIREKIADQKFSTAFKKWMKSLRSKEFIEIKL
ncbi:MAG: hypothetical protein D6726_07735 [Nitrospirae bacterium]|nr:MAG: hypothetical protein D6726_07735 [Nitrospirota bacterium]